MKKRILSLFLAVLMIVSLLPTVALATNSAGFDNFKKVQTYTDGKFTDVKAGDWFEKNVSSAYELNLMVGKRNDFFDTGSNLTVAEAMTIAARLREIYYTGKAEFKQAEGPTWYKVYTDYCKENKIADPADYDMNSAITRGQFADIFAKAFPADALKKINTVQDNMIPDVKNTDKFGKAIYLLYRAGIIVGNDKKGTFSPDSNIRRMEVVAIATRMAQPSLRQNIILKKPSSGGSGSYVPSVVSVTGVSLDKTEITLTVGDDDLKLVATVAPENATDKSVTWQSNNTDVATVDSEGNVNAVSAGTATITATTVDGRKTATCTVTVTAAASFKAIFNTSGGALTFYYDAVDHSGEGITVYQDGTDNYMFDSIKTTGQMWGYNDIRANIKSVDIDSSVANYHGLTSTAYMFQNMQNAESIIGAEYLDVSNVTDMTSMFSSYGRNSTGLNAVPDVSRWNTGNVTNLSSMFSSYGYNSKNLAIVPDVSSWNTSNVTKMGSMFDSYGYKSTGLNAVPDVSSWNTSNVTKMGSMFASYGINSTGLNAVPNVNNWNTCNVTDMGNMFQEYGKESLVLDTVPAVSKWDTKNVESMKYMFNGYGIHSTVVDFTLDLSCWSVANVKDYNKMFQNAGKVAKTWSVTIPGKTGNQANDTTHWYVGDGTNTEKYIEPANDKYFTLPTPATTYTVTFDLNGITGTAPEVQTITSGEKVTKPEDPTDTIHTFAGWYKTKDEITGALSDLWDFDNDTVIANVTLYAGWKTTIEKLVGEIPSSDSKDSAPENAWIATGSDGTNKCYKAAENETTKLFFYSPKNDANKTMGIPVSTVVTKVGKDYTYSNDTIKFIMTDGKLSSIQFKSTNSNYTKYDGTYAPAANISVTGISVDPTSLTGVSGVVTVTIFPANATNKEFTVSIENQGDWRYEINGNQVTFNCGGSPGNKTATITSVDGGLKVTVQLNFGA